jgi:hypothetical protein
MEASFTSGEEVKGCRPKASHKYCTTGSRKRCKSAFQIGVTWSERPSLNSAQSIMERKNGPHRDSYALYRNRRRPHCRWWRPRHLSEYSCGATSLSRCPRRHSAVPSLGYPSTAHRSVWCWANQSSGADRPGASRGDLLHGAAFSLCSWPFNANGS